MVEIVPAFPSEQFAVASASVDFQLKASKGAIFTKKKDHIYLSTLLANAVWGKNSGSGVEYLDIKRPRIWLFPFL